MMGEDKSKLLTIWSNYRIENVQEVVRSTSEGNSLQPQTGRSHLGPDSERNRTDG